MLCDVYDGKVWKHFLSYNDHPFLSEQGNFVAMMNMDFFQTSIQFSMGAIYLTILNPTTWYQIVLKQIAQYSNIQSLQYHSNVSARIRINRVFM